MRSPMLKESRAGAPRVAMRNTPQNETSTPSHCLARTRSPRGIDISMMNTGVVER